jgi:hypothetical protein
MPRAFWHLWQKQHSCDQKYEKQETYECGLKKRNSAFTYLK